MACGATLKRHREFDPLQNSPDRSPKRICLPIDFKSPSTHARLLNGPAFVEAAQKLINDQWNRRSPGWEKQSSDVGSVLLRASSCSSGSAAAAAVSLSSSSSPATVSSTWLTGGSRPTVTRPLMRSERAQPLLTVSQVESMCRNIVRDHEDRVREEFDNILANKLAEQYEGFLRFNQEQIHMRFDRSDASYVS